MRLTAHAPAKVNLCLYVGRPRPDGYHPLVSVVQALSLADEVLLEPAEGARDEVICAGVQGENLAARALAAYREAAGWRARPQRLTITKRVPIAAGMGGGSGDAAAALRLAAAAAHRPGDPVCEELAPRLGADVAAMLAGGRVLMSGVGERVERLGGPLDAGLLVLPSPHALSTPAVYREFDRLGLGRSPDELAALGDEIRASGASEIHNDLEPAALSLCPPIAAALERLRAAGADDVLVSGSGPTTVGVFRGAAGARRASEAAAAVPGALAVEPVGAAYGAPRRLA